MKKWEHLRLKEAAVIVAMKNNAHSTPLEGVEQLVYFTMTNIK